MLHLVLGADPLFRQKALAAILKKEKGEAIEISLNEVSAGRLHELARSQELFGEKPIFVIKNLLDEAEIVENILKNKKALVSSPNTFIIIDREATKVFIDGLEKAGGEVNIEKKDSKKAPRPKGFWGLADALALRDRKAAWALLLGAFREGASAEELHGILFWQVKNLLLVKESKENPGLSPYPYMKAKQAVSKWESKELKEALSSLVFIYHEAHRGVIDFPIGLETFVLERS